MPHTDLTVPRDDIQERFEAFHAEHPEIYAHVVKIARQTKAAGYSHYSIDAVIQVVRFHRNVTCGERGFKLNNDFRSRYARMVMQREPDLQGFFETRGLRAEMGPKRILEAA